MNERIKEIRKLAKLNQTDFANALQVPLSTIQSYETGRRTPSTAFVNLMCSRYGINPEWVLTGDGPMELPKDREQEIAAITATLFNDDDPFRKNLCQLICEMTPDQIALFKDLANKLLEMQKENLQE